MSEEEITALVVHPAFRRAVKRQVLHIMNEALKAPQERRGHMPATNLTGSGVVPHADAAKRADMAVGTLINLIADGYVLGDAQNVHEPDLVDYMLNKSNGTARRSRS